jgi:amidophosphoribosyltransferase
MEGLIAATTIDESALCTACFTGKYPIRIPTSLLHDQQLLPLLES